MIRVELFFMGKLIFITIEKLLEMKANDEKFKLVEVLPEESYKNGHIPGAIYILLNKLSGLWQTNISKRRIQLCV